MAEVSTTDRDCDSPALTSLQGDTLEALELLHWTLYLRRGTRYIDLGHLFSINSGGIGEVKLHVEAFGGRLNFQIAIHKLSIGEAKPEGIGHWRLLAVVPTITHQALFCVVGNELLPAVVATVTGDVYEDITLVIIVDMLGIGARSVGWHILQTIRPRHRQLARGRHLTRQDFRQRLTTHRAIKPRCQ